MKKYKILLVSFGKKLFFYIILIILWELIFQVGVKYLGIWKVYTFPSPVTVEETLIDLMKDNTLWIAILTSMRRIAIGYSISLLSGLIIGLTITKSRYLEENLKPLILGLQTLPSICWLPFAILWFGLDESSIIFIIAVGSTFAIAIAIEAGISTINPLYLKAAKTMGAEGIYKYTHVIFPAALPSVVSGMKQSWSFAWRALMAGEMLSATKGLGQVLMMGRELGDISRVVAVMIVIIVIGLVVDKFVFSRIEENVKERWGLSRSNAK